MVDTYANQPLLPKVETHFEYIISVKPLLHGYVRYARMLTIEFKSTSSKRNNIQHLDSIHEKVFLG